MNLEEISSKTGSLNCKPVLNIELVLELIWAVQHPYIAVFTFFRRNKKIKKMEPTGVEKLNFYFFKK